MVLGGVHDSVALPVALGCATAMENGARETLAVPSDTEIVMPLYLVPARLLAGLPESRPVELLNVAQVGRLAIEKVSVLPSGSDAVGWNE